MTPHITIESVHTRLASSIDLSRGLGQGKKSITFHYKSPHPTTHLHPHPARPPARPRPAPAASPTPVRRPPHPPTPEKKTQSSRGNEDKAQKPNLIRKIGEPRGQPIRISIALPGTDWADSVHIFHFRKRVLSLTLHLPPSCNIQRVRKQFTSSFQGGVPELMIVPPCLFLFGVKKNQKTMRMHGRWKK